MSKQRKVLVDPNQGQNFNPADFTPYDQYNAPKSDFSTGVDVSSYDYQADPSVDRNNISPYDLPTLNDTRAANQGALSSLGNSFAKFVGKTGLNIIGGVGGTIYGVGSAIANGDVKKIWDNGFADTVDSMTQKLDDTFKIYKSSEYENANFLQKILHPLQFIDDTSDALSFTAGAILTELASQGAASASVVPKALKYMKFLSKGAEAAEATQELATTGNVINKLGDFGRLTRQLATGASYESIVEARQATMALRDKMYADYARENGDTPMPQNIKDDIDNRLAKAGVFSYLSNLALVGTTNILEFPKIFGVGYKSAKAAEGSIVRNLETGLYEAAEGTTSKTSRVLNALKNPFYEGGVEEGLQNVIQNTNQHYFDRKNNKEGNIDVQNYLYDFATNLADTYTSKEGWNQIGMGMIIGALGAPGRGTLSVLGKNNSLGRVGYDVQEDGSLKRAPIWTGGLLEHGEEAAHERAQIQSIVNDLNQNTDLGKSMQANYDFLVQNKGLENEKQQALANNDIFNFNNAKDDQIHSYVTSRIKAGLYDEVLDTVDKMKQLSPDEFYTQFKGEEANNQTTDLDKIKYQQDTINEFATKAENTNQAFKLVDNVYRGNNNDIREELIHAVASSKNLDFRENSINQELASLSKGLISNFNGINYGTSLRKDETISIKDRIQDINNLLKSDDVSNESKTTLKEELDNYNKAPNKDFTINEHNLMENLKQVHPTDYALNKDQITTLLSDSRKLRERRQSYLDLYNSLFTKEGQDAFEKQQEDIRKQDIQQQEENAAKEAEKARETEKINNNKETKKKVDEAISSGATETGGINQPKKVNTNTKTNTVQDYNNLPNVNIFDEEDGDIHEPIITPENTNNTSTNTNITPEEQSIANIENHKEDNDVKQEELKNNQLVKSPTEELADQHLTELEDINISAKRTIGNTIAYLGAEYNKNGEKYTNKYDEAGNLELNKNTDPKLASQNYYNPGSKVTLKPVKFSEMQERGLGKYTENDFNNDIKDVNKIPIGIYDSNNKLIGYLPTQEGIRNNVANDYLESALKSNLDLRTTIFNNPGSYDTTISTKSPGFLTLNKTSNQKNLFDALGDGSKLANKVKLAIGKELGTVNLYTGSNEIFSDGNIVNSNNLQNGYIYSIVPSSQSDNYIAYPMKINTIGENNAKTILEAIKLFAKLNTKSALSANDTQSINNITEYDLNNFKDLSTFINKIMYNDVNGNDNTIFKLYKDNLILSRTGGKYKLSDILSNKDTQNEIINILKDRFHTIELNNLNSNNKFYNYSLKDGIISEDKYNNYQDYLNKNGVISSNIQSNHIDGNEYTFTTQSVIGLSNDTIKQQNEPEAITQSEPILQPINTQESLKYKDITIGQDVMQGNKKGVISKKANGNVVIDFDSGGKLTIKPEFTEIYPVNSESVANNLQEAINRLKGNQEESNQEVNQPKLTNDKLFDPSKKKPKNLSDFDVSPDYIVQQTIKSGEDLKKRCL